MQAEEQQKLTGTEKATLFMQFLEKIRKLLAAKASEEKRNKPPTQAQQRKIMCTYLKNLEGKKLKDLKNNLKRAREELTHGSSKKQKVDDDKETTELMKIIPDKEKVAIDAIPLAVKSLKIVDWKIHKEGKKCYYQIIRADENSNKYARTSQKVTSWSWEHIHGLKDHVVVKRTFLARNNGIATTSRGNYAAGQAKFVKCYNYPKEWHMEKQCTQLKGPRYSAWFKEKLMLVEAQEADCDDISSAKVVLMENLSSCDLDVLSEDTNSSAPNDLLVISLPEQMTDHVANLDRENPTNKMTEYLDAYDSDCDDISSAKVVLMENLSSCDLDVLSEVSYSDTYLNDMINQDVQEMPYSEQTHIKDSPNNEITSDSNIILYSQYLQELQNASIQDANSSAPNHLLVISLLEQMTDHVANLDRENPTNKMDTLIRKLKDRIKSLSGKDSVENVKKDVDEIETINIELEYSVAKLLSENENLRKYQEHLKSIYKDQFYSIRKIRVQSKEHSASLITQINEKYVENLDLNAQLQEKVFAIVALKNKLRKLKGKNVVETVVSKPIATIAPGMFKLDIEPISHRLKNNREAHKVYLENTIENTDTLRRLVECARKQNPIEP
uniref:Retrovirus-related Pol polyprotein from transposon TNT 1-94 n=1 Tax=Tanacetum cinerariifolium TaxID=118510 RepID=A0A699GK13_TANCI|nr:hypothetical protein [Tanacetum cinerariifolium]